MMIKKILVCLICSALMITAASCQEVQEVEKEKDENYLQAPDFIMPKGEHLSLTGQFLSEELYKKLWSFIEIQAAIWPDSLTDDLSSTEIATMINILSDDRILGDGLYHDAGYGEIPGSFSRDYSWSLSMYPDPNEWRKYETVMRMYPNGTGISPANIEITFGAPRFKNKFKNIQHLVYGNVDLFYDEEEKYLGTTFLFKRSKDNSKIKRISKEDGQVLLKKDDMDALAEQEANMTKEEKVLSWIDEKIILLPHYPGSSEKTFSGSYPYGKPKAKLSVSEYVGKIGVITNVVYPKKQPAYPRYTIEITLDKSDKKIVTHYESHLGFISEMEFVRNKIVGRAFWAKRRLKFFDEMANASEKQALEQVPFEINILTKFTVNDAQWGYSQRHIILYVETEDSRKGRFNSYQNHPMIMSRFHVNTYSGDIPFTDCVYIENPRFLYPHWSEDIWELIENEEIAIGMTEDMARFLVEDILENMEAFFQNQAKYGPFMYIKADIS